MDLIFNACVVFLQDLAQLTGMTYKQINVLIFCILWPLFTLWMIILVIKYRNKIKELKSLIDKNNLS